jgi:hypothetical protein
VGLSLQPAAAAAHLQVGTVPTLLWEAASDGIVLAIAEAKKKLTVPDGLPGIGEHIAGRDVIRLAGKHVAIGLNADGIFGGVAAFGREPQGYR